MNLYSFGYIVVGFILLYPVQLTETVAFYNSQFCVNSYHPADEDINKKKNWIVFFSGGATFLGPCRFGFIIVTGRLKVTPPLK